ncbi:class I SAM-dependent methyltransferase [Paenibacillus hamazuiensis]|uniref:class I SAM-dependent methyltransferase n=1 Tax=Paenibacillus hamazuiensis TaxID=2936508 RepID=UPI00200DB743|nr:class I SAM-dependent methyltransferase [Paenibacillus hamazuiensis]
MGFVSILSFAHQCAAARVRPGDVVVDATLGNGNDAMFLAKLVGDSGVVYGFDVQEQAIRKTGERLEAEFGAAGHIRLLLASHAEMEAHLPPDVHGHVAAIMFNLGYLPGDDHSVITRPDSTLPALEAATRLLKKGGIVTIVVYPGHEGGAEEARAVDAWCSGLPQERFQVLQYRFTNQKNSPPYLIAVEKKLS